MTNQKDVVLTVYYADCLPILFFDKRNRCIAAVHSGWRGTASGIAVEAVRSMSETYGSKPEELIAVLGPSACGKCYQTGGEVVDAMKKAYGTICEPYIRRESGEKWLVDNAEINAAALRRAGIPQENIIKSGLCTMCGENHGDFWSHRLTNGIRGVHAAFISLN